LRGFFKTNEKTENFTTLLHDVKTPAEVHISGPLGDYAEEIETYEKYRKQRPRRASSRRCDDELTKDL